jgi:hypothetical protein
MRMLPVLVPIGLLALLIAAAPGGCRKGLSDKEIRRIVRDEVQEQLRERKRRQAPRGAATAPMTTADPARATSPTSAHPKQRRAERLRRRIQTLESLVKRFSKSPGVSPKRVTMMKQQLARMRERLARELREPPTLTTPTPTPTPGPPVTGGQTRKVWEDALAVGIRLLGKQRWEIDRRILASVLKDPGFARTDAAILPHLVGGKPRGLKLKRVSPKGIFADLGLKTGDVIARVNNTLLTDPNKALALYASLSKARLVTVVLRRGGRRILHVYTVK